jgi:hypothetical protein
MVVHRDGSLAHYTLDLLVGVMWDLEGEHVRVGLTPSRRWAAESEWGPRDRSVLSPTGSSPGQTTSLHVANLNWDYVDIIEATSTP